MVPQDDDDDESENDDEGEGPPQKSNEAQTSSGSSSSDDNDSAAAAHAAAIGHSPQPLPTKVVVPPPGNDALPGDKGDDNSNVNGNGKAAEVPAEKDSDEKKPTSADDKVPEAATGDVGRPEESKASSSPMVISPKEDSKGESKEDVSTDVGEGGEGKAIANGKTDTTPEQQKASKPKKKKPKYYCPHNLNERDNDENTPLHVAIHARKLNHVKILLEAGASVHKKSDGSPPIHTAISVGSIARHSKFAYDCVVALHENGADLTAKDESLQTPLYLACMHTQPHIASYILSSEAGQSTLNARADRSQGRALHAAAKFDQSHLKRGQRASTVAHAYIPQLRHHHPDGTVANAMHHIPGFPGKPQAASSDKGPSAQGTSTQALLVQILLATEGIEIDATNTVGQTALHFACARGNWIVVRLLLQAGANPDLADRRGFTPGQLAHKRGMPIPNDLMETLGGPPSSGTVAPPRDLIVDPDSTTLLLTHELCGLHRTCSPIRRDSSAEPPPENVRRLHVLVDQETGILRTGEFSRCTWEGETRRAALVDVLKVRRIKTTYFVSRNVVVGKGKNLPRPPSRPFPFRPFDISLF